MISTTQAGAATPSEANHGRGGVTKAAEKKSIAGSSASGADSQPSLPLSTDDMMDALPRAAVSKSEADGAPDAAVDYDMEELD